jgi:two-component system, NarL family, sensor kinase
MPEDFRDIQEGLSGYVKIGTTVFLTLAALFIFFISASIQRRKKMINSQKLMKADFEKALLQTQLEIQEQTLRTISQEIHDNVGQVLSLAKLNLNTLDMNGSNKEQKIKSSIQLVSKAINDLRDLSRSLNGDKIADLGLQDAIDNELKIIANTGQFKTELMVSGDPYKLQQQQEMVLFRIVQEALNNTVKHSKARNINIEMHYETAAFKMAINDNGEGFAATELEATETGIGLNNMKNRASLVGALFSIQSLPGSGTSVLIQLPQNNT